MVVAEALGRLDFRDPHTMALAHSLAVPCKGVDHMDFSADGTYVIASCEFAGKVIKVDVARQEVVGSLELRKGGMPQDVKLSPDGKIFYVADMAAGGLFEVDGETLRVTGFLPTGKGTHGLYVSRDSKYLYAANRGEGSVSVVDLAGHSVVATWRIPGGGSPDMGGLSADGATLWPLRSLQLRGVRLRYLERTPARTREGRPAAPRLVLLSAARPLFPRPYGGVPLSTIGRC